MPIVISEIGIRLSVNDGAPPSRNSNRGALPPLQTGQSEPHVEDIVRQCVQRVLESLRMHGAR